MAVTPSYPGVYVQEVSSSNHGVIAVATANTAFVDVFERGPEQAPVPISNFGEFEATFGGLSRRSRASYGIYQFFLNGGSLAWVIRVAGKNAKTAAVKIELGDLIASGSGAWGNQLDAACEQDGDGFNLVIRELSPQDERHGPKVAHSEIYRGLSADPADRHYWQAAIQHQSGLVRVPEQNVSPAPAAVEKVRPSDSISARGHLGDPANTSFTRFAGGEDDFTIGPTDLGQPGDAGKVPGTGYFTLDTIAPQIFNLLCLPAMAGFNEDEWSAAFGPAKEYCEQKRAFFIVDPPAGTLKGDAAKQTTQIQNWFEGTSGETISNQTNQAAVYFPRIRIPDPGPEGVSAPMDTEISGTMAGIYAATDAARGVWKAPAGTEAVLSGVLGPAVEVDDAQNGVLNPLGINCIRKFPVYGTVSWGARTIQGADALASEWKYVPVRRLANFIEMSLDQSTGWAVFEPNDETLWSALRLSVGAFMDDLYKQGAFAGSSATDAYFVKCDQTTMSQHDQEQGVVIIQVGFAPTRPAEFVIITIRQIANQ